MVYRRAPAKPRRRLRPRRRLALTRPVGRRAGMMRANPRTLKFVEMFDAGSFAVSSMTGTAVGQLTASIASITQLSEYARLYNQYCITRLTYTLIPTYTDFAVGQDVTTTDINVSCPRLAWSVQQSSVASTVTNELSVLQQNGSKLVMFNKPIRISFVPVPWTKTNYVTSAGGSLISVPVTKKYQWFSFDESGAIPHGTINYCVSQFYMPAATTPVTFRAYCKVHFSVRDAR